jgi:hypothetical protein
VLVVMGASGLVPMVVDAMKASMHASSHVIDDCLNLSARCIHVSGISLIVGSVPIARVIFIQRVSADLYVSHDDSWMECV